MNEAKSITINKIIVNLPKEKVDFINNTHQKELNYWKKIPLVGKNEDDKKQLMDLARLRTFLACKDVVKNEVKIDEKILYLKTHYQPHNLHNQEQESLIDDIPNQEDFTFDIISARLKLFSKSTREVENTALKNKVLLWEWVSKAAKVFRREENRGIDLP